MTRYFICQRDLDNPRLYSDQLVVDTDYDTAMFHADMTHKHTGQPAWVELEDGTVVYETDRKQPGPFDRDFIFIE